MAFCNCCGPFPVDEEGGRCRCFSTGELAGGLQRHYLLCSRMWQLYGMKTNSCPQRRSLHLKISCDLELMNYLEQFELDFHLHQIESSFKPTLINPPCLPTPGSSKMQGGRCPRQWTCFSPAGERVSALKCWASWGGLEKSPFTWL